MIRKAKSLCQGIDIDDSKSKIVVSAIALTAIGADLKPGGATP